MTVADVMSPAVESVLSFRELCLKSLPRWAPFHPNVAGALVAPGVARRRRAAWDAASGHKARGYIRNRTFGVLLRQSPLREREAA